jgi:transcriptional regulator with XRE-family HTH domain
VSESIFAQKVLQRRKERKLSLREIARVTGIAASTISRIENGHLSPTLDVATKLALALNLDPPTANPNPNDVHSYTTSIGVVEGRALEAPAQVVVYRKLGHTILREGIRRDLSRIASRNGYELAILLKGTLQLRTNDGFRENLKPGATINCKLITRRTYFAIAAKRAELLWIA